MEPTDKPTDVPPGDTDPAPIPPVRRRPGVRHQLRDAKTRPVTIVLLGTAGLLVLGLAYWIFLVSRLPSTDDLRRSRFERATVVYAADGTELTSYQDKNRTWVPLSEISPHVVNALLAAEDHRFYEHHGIDFFRTAGAFFRTLGGDAQGGSTITMQLARNAFSDIYDDGVVTRKIKEWITAVRLERMYEKDEILEMYLNTVPFMYNAFGIEAAAQTYFQASAKALNPKGAATLVGMLKGTVFYNPVRHPERSHERRNVVLQKMVEHGYLEQREYEQMKDVPSRLRFKRLSRSAEMAPYFTTYLRQWLDEWAERSGRNLYTDGLRVYTTIDPALQQAAEKAVQRVGTELQAVADVEWSRSRSPFFSPNASAYAGYRRNVSPFEYFWSTHGKLLDEYIRQSDEYAALRDEGLPTAEALERLRGDAAFIDSIKTMRQRLQAGFVAIEPQSGHVKAWVGGRDYGEIQFDHVAQSKRQPGSTFKPFVYAAALENGFNPESQIRDEAVEFVDPDTRRRWRPKNVGSVSGQLVSLRDALAYSKNTVTARLVMDLGPRRVVETAQRMGIQSELPAYPSIGLGTGEVSLLELAGAYTSIADYGQYHEPVFVTRIEDQEGYVLASFGGESRSAISAVTAYELIDMMRGVVQYGTGQRIRYMFGAEGDLAGKTGTTQNGADGWFMLLHPNLVMGSWVGFDVPAIRFRSDYWGQGAHNALHVVGQFYRAARQQGRLRNASFAAPPGYIPPMPVDSTLFAAYGDSSYYSGYYDSAYYDSLQAVTDSLLGGYDYGYEGDYERDTTWRSLYDRRGEYEESMTTDEEIPEPPADLEEQPVPPRPRERAVTPEPSGRRRSEGATNRNVRPASPPASAATPGPPQPTRPEAPPPAEEPPAEEPLPEPDTSGTG